MSKTLNIYTLPIATQHLCKVVSDPQLHSGFLSQALDFLLPENTPILAAQAGEVIEVKVDSNQGGARKKYLGNQYLNWITIAHTNDEFSQYAHLKHQGAVAQKGDWVKAGDIIGYSGNTGFSTCPHLHFHVYETAPYAPGWRTKNIQFQEDFQVIRNKYRIIYEIIKFKIKP
ncbi:hypothetical protein BKI52_03910 [marine bacterium AO1-C]|nr:hypothetical protein BKI52_03910 [marine bacterium AO1-C]